MRFVIRHPSGEQKIVLNTASFKRPWYVIGVVKDPQALPTAAPLSTDEEKELTDLGLSFVELEKARKKFGTNISIKALIQLIKARGL